MIKKFIKEAFKKFGFEIRNARYFDARNAYNTQHAILNRVKPLNQFTIFDIGAFDGRSTVQYKMLFPQAFIYAFEPFNESYSILKEKTKNYSNVNTYNLGLYETTGKLNLNCNISPSTNSILDSNEIQNEIDDVTKTIKTQTIEVTTLDQFARLNQIEIIDILKLDVQGTELSVLKGSKELLAKQKIKLIYLETEFVEIYKSQPLFNDLFYYLKKYNYKFYNFYNLQVSQNNQLLWSDAIFVSAEVEKEINKYDLFA